jgi:hypothetical protein
MGLPIRGRFSKGGFTATAGTVINALIPPKKNAFTVATVLRYNAGATLHTLTILKPQGTTTLSADASAGQKVINLTADPGTSLKGPNGTASRLANNGIAGSDWLAFEAPDGTIVFDKVSSVATLAITMTTNIPTNGVKSGAKVWFFGVAGDSDPFTAEAFYSLIGPASALTEIADTENGIASSNHQYEPLLVQSSNGSNAGTIDLVDAVYSAVG